MIKVTVNFNFKFMILIDAKGRSYDLSFTRCIWLVIFVDAKSDARVAGQLVPQLPAHPTVSLVAASTGIKNQRYQETERTRVGKIQISLRFITRVKYGRAH